MKKPTNKEHKLYALLQLTENNQDILRSGNVITLLKEGRLGDLEPTGKNMLKVVYPGFKRRSCLHGSKNDFVELAGMISGW
jgi:hypothetical protein